MDLQLATIDDIAEELKTRYDTVVIAAARLRTEEQEEGYYFYHGLKLSCAGLTAMLGHRIAVYAMDDEDDVGDD